MLRKLMGNAFKNDLLFDPDLSGEFKSFQHFKSIFNDFYTALTFLFTFCVKTKSKSLPG